MRRWNGLARLGAALALLPGAIGILAAAASPALADPTSPAGHWGKAKPISLAGLKAKDGEIDEMSCPSPGYCTATGSYHDAAGIGQSFVVSEVNGTWGQASTIPGLNALNKGPFDAVDTISCGSKGNCALGGAYPDANGEFQPFVADSVNGTWGQAHKLITVHTGFQQFTAAVTTISCTVSGYCAAGVTLPSILPGTDGTPDIVPDAFIATDQSGTWSAVQAFPAFTGFGPPSEITSISCWGPGNCLAGGAYGDFGRHRHPLLVEQNGGTWKSEPLPGVTALPGYNPNGDSAVTSVSCPGGNCTVAGAYADASFHTQDFVSDFGPQGQWITQAVPGSLALNEGLVFFPLVSCGDLVGDCAFASDFQSSTRHDGVLVDTESGGNGSGAGGGNGNWGTAQQVQGINTGPEAGEQSLSCGGAGSCVIGGLFQFDASGRPRAYIAEETGGVWGAGRRVAGNLDAGNFSSTNIVSCAAPGNCAAGGSYEDANAKQLPFVVDESTATTATLTLSAATVRFGREGTEHLTVKVTSRTSGTPSGQVTIKAGSAMLCSFTLTKGKGTCSLGPKRLKPGTYHLVATYQGTGYDGSKSPRRTLTVTK